jgi:transcriptional regulator with XRE-family HTH domain
MSSQFGDKIRTLREEQNLLLRQVASILEIDTALLSKIERGERQAKKEIVIRVAKILKTKAEGLLTLWLADKVYKLVEEEQFGYAALILAEEKVKYTKKIKNEKE